MAKYVLYTGMITTKVRMGSLLKRSKGCIPRGNVMLLIYGVPLRIMRIGRKAEYRRDGISLVAEASRAEKNVRTPMNISLIRRYIGL